MIKYMFEYRLIDMISNDNINKDVMIKNFLVNKNIKDLNDIKELSIKLQLNNKVNYIKFLYFYDMLNKIIKDKKEIQQKTKDIQIELKRINKQLTNDVNFYNTLKKDKENLKKDIHKDEKVEKEYLLTLELLLLMLDRIEKQNNKKNKLEKELKTLI